ncbi:hypothetical protein BDCR2A_01548 [Borrelia duttonii CR2A]|uniref:Uncharacterized protein n=1 Tax=Borrelia duttonii CR2A TaxID=1432657 RepID=W6TWQ3_9SPIR|nr:hypothetical protein BDCR2A_01548 [Borrelia duttonii CR2A]
MQERNIKNKNYLKKGKLDSYLNLPYILNSK